MGTIRQGLLDAAQKRQEEQGYGTQISPRRVVLETPKMMRFLKYHVAPEDAGVETRFASCIAVNMVMGSGFLALPFVFARAGLALSAVVILVVASCMTLTCGWEAEAMSRAEALETKKLRCDEEEESKAMVVSNRSFEVVELCAIFGGKRLQVGYTVLFLVYLLTTSWAYAFVFAEALSTTMPLRGMPTCEPDEQCPLFRVYAIVFACVAVPLSMLEPGEMMELQVGMTGLRILVAFLMSATALYAYFAREQSRLFPSVPFVSSATPMWRWSGLGELLPAAIFALNLNGSVPLVAKAMKKREELPTALRAGIGLPCLLYLIIGLSLAFAFGTAVPRSANVAWESFYSGEEVPLWAQILRALVVLFPAADVLSVFPLNTMVIANNLIALVAGERADKAQRNKKLGRMVRFLVSLPPIFASCLLSDFIQIVDYCGVLAIVVSCVFPPVLAILGHRECRRVFGDDRHDVTKFALDGPRLDTKIGLVALGAATILVILFNSS